jgi:hypothetical protein
MVKQSTVVVAVPLTVIIEDLTNVDNKNNAWFCHVFIVRINKVFQRVLVLQVLGFM